MTLIGSVGVIPARLLRPLGISVSLLMLTAASCIRIGVSVPSTVYTPDLVGPIKDIQEVPGNDLAHDVVVGDQTIRITPDEPRPLGGGGLAEDWLFMYGGEGDESWFMVLTRATTGELAGCYTPSMAAVFDDGSHLIFALNSDEGLRLPKGATLVLPSPDPDTGAYPFPGGPRFCIEADGTVSRSGLPS